MNPRTQLAERMWRAYSVARLNAAVSDASATPWVELGYDERSAWLAAARAAEGELLAGRTVADAPLNVGGRRYRPRQGGVAWKTIEHVHRHPESRLTAKVIGELFGCRASNVHHMLLEAERAGLLGSEIGEGGIKVYGRPPRGIADEPAAPPAHGAHNPFGDHHDR